jgi:hypothetical protein
MKTLKNMDFTIVLLLFIFLGAAVTSLPFDADQRTDMSSAQVLTVNVESLTLRDGQLFMGTRLVEADPQVDVVSIMDQREEINVRVSDNRISVIVGDN